MEAPPPSAPPPPPPTHDGSGSERARTPTSAAPAAPAAPGSSRLMTARVLLLDDSLVPFYIQLRSPGRTLLDMVCKHLSLLETDYFGLEYVDSHGVKYWLDLERPLGRQMELSQQQPVLWFCVKFYTPEPAQLEDEFTRYLFALQLKRDLAQGHLQCNDNTAALLASYIIQAECGDFTPEECGDGGYLSGCRLVPGQDSEMERRIMDSHRRLVGLTPAEADIHLLETARRCELYGMKMHPAKDHEGVPLNLSVAHMGIVVFQNFYKISTFSWAKIRKLSFKRRRFLIKLHPEGHGYYKDTVEFFFDSRNHCKNFWKKCVEHHGFFRCLDVVKKTRSKPIVMSKGSSFRFSGRTQKQMIEYARENYVKRQGFIRSQSFRTSGALPGSNLTHMGSTSVSAHPLIPTDLQPAPPTQQSPVGTSGSLSYGSATLHSSTATVPQSPLSAPSSTERADGDSSSRTGVSPPPPPAPAAAVTSLRRQQSGPRPTPPPRAEGSSLPILSVDEADALNGNGSALPTYADAVGRHPHTGAPAAPAARTSASEPTSRTSASEPTTGRSSVETSTSPPPAADARRKPRRIPADKAFFIAKEMLSTERTYKTDLRILTVRFREALEKQPGAPLQLLEQLLQLLEPVYSLHCQLLRSLEQRLIAWEQSSGGGGGDAPQMAPPPRVCDVLCQAGLSDAYAAYIDGYVRTLELLNREYRSNETFKQTYREFEMQKLCYLPVTALVLKPAQRLLHLQTLLQKLVQHYGSAHADLADASCALSELDALCARLAPGLPAANNMVKMSELQRDLVGCDGLLTAARDTPRRFIREGCLQKLSKKGYQHRMFFLFCDVLIYTSRTTSPVPQFKVHGQLPLRGVTVERTDSQLGIANCFTIFGGNRALVIAANSSAERDAWLRDLRPAIEQARAHTDTPLTLDLLPACSSSDEIMSGLGVGGAEVPAGSLAATSLADRQPNWRSNRSAHVCWHRGISVSMAHTADALHAQLSGYLLRKFKNSDGWQKLWVVLTHFCLYFYKTFQDECPLTSLPLLGYVVSEPAASDNILKEHVFKLQFKQHVYFFRAESRYTLERWLEVIERTASTH